MTKLLIGALSGWQHTERRGRCLASWMRDAERLDLTAVFLLGCAPLAAPEQIGPHALALPCPDDYATLPQRTHWFCRWALERPDWDYLFKCDDDTYVSLPRLAAAAAVFSSLGREYIGAEWRPGVAYGSGGAGYLLSRRAAAIVVERMTEKRGAEDQLVGQALRDAGISLTLDGRFIPWGSLERRPATGNAIITVHGVGADVFEASHRDTGAGG